MQAANKIFHIPELLEAVLSHLPLPDLLFAQGVCRHWQQSIATSPLLQQRLFFQSAPGNIIKGRNNHPAKTKPQWESNPLLTWILPKVRMPGSGPDEHYESEPWMYPNDDEDRKVREAMMRPDASWRRMYPLQPSARIFSISLYGWCCGAGEEEAFFINKHYEWMQKEGATMGFIYDLVVMLLDTNSSEGVCRDWNISFVEEKGLKVYLSYPRECFGSKTEETGLKIVNLDCNVITDVEDGDHDSDESGEMLEDDQIPSERNEVLERARFRARGSQRGRRGMRGRGWGAMRS